MRKMLGIFLGGNLYLMWCTDRQILSSSFLLWLLFSFSPISVWIDPKKERKTLCECNWSNSIMSPFIAEMVLSNKDLCFFFTRNCLDEFPVLWMDFLRNIGGSKARFSRRKVYSVLFAFEIYNFTIANCFNYYTLGEAAPLNK